MQNADEAWRNKDYKATLTQVQKAMAHVNQAEKRLEKKKKKELKGDNAEVFRTTLGELHFLKACCLRDQELAKAGLEGKAPPDIIDTINGERFRSFLNIENEEVRKSAVQTLRIAAQLAPNKHEIVLEALRTEVMTSPTNWSNVQALAQAIIQIKPDDARALYLLARYDFEQPAGNPPVAFQPANKRQPERIAKALELVRKSHAKDAKPAWRFLHLEQQILLWQLHDARRRGGDTKPILANLERLLWTDGNGALARLSSADAMTNLSTWDVDGIFETPVIALEILRESPEGAADNSKKARSIVESFLSFCKNKAVANESQFSRRVLIERATQVMNLSMPFWSHDDPDHWAKALDQLQELFQLDSTPPAGVPAAYAQFAYLLMAQPAAFKDREKRIERVLAAGSSADKGTVSGANSLQAAWGYWKTAQGAPRKDIALHLQALAGPRGKPAPFEWNLLDSYLNLRDGSLQKAYEESAAAAAMVPAEQRWRAHVVQVKTLLGLGHYEKAIATLRFLGAAHKDGTIVTLPDRLWLDAQFQGQNEINYLLTRAQFDMAKDRVLRYRAEKKGAEPPDGWTEVNEKEADVLLKRLPAKSSYAALARQDKIRYLLFRHRVAAAKDEWKTLESEWPGTLAVLSAQLLLATHENAGDATNSELRKAWSTGDKKSEIQELMMAILEARAGNREAALAAVNGIGDLGSLPGEQLDADHLLTLAETMNEKVTREAAKGLAYLLQGAVRRYPYDPRLCLMLGKTQHASGDLTASRMQFQRAANLCRNPLPSFSTEQLRTIGKTVEQHLAKSDD